MKGIHTLKTILLLILSLHLLSMGPLTAQATAAVQTQLGYPGGDDWEPAIAADRGGHVYVLWPHYKGVPGCGACPSPTALLHISSDHGQTWSAPKVVTPNNPGTSQVDTQIVVDPADGRTVYASWLQNNKSDTLVIKSTDFGQTWTPPVIADHTNVGTDKDILVVKGHDVYVGFSHIQKNWVSSSHDGGATFTSVQVAQNNEFGTSLGGGAAIDSRGNVYFAWVGYPRSTNGLASLYITRSTDGGRTWTRTVIDTSAQPPDCSQFNCGYQFLGAQIVITVDASDTLYALWNSGTVYKGPERIYFAKSTDRGATWSPKQDVSLAPAGVNHAFPAITTSRSAGDIRIAWMDARNRGQWNVYHRSSANGGVTWSSETKLSSFVPGYSYLNADGFSFPYGDYFEMDVDELNNTHTIWGEGPNYTGPGNIWYIHVNP